MFGFSAASLKSNLIGYISLEPIYVTNLHFYHVLDEEFAYRNSLANMEVGLYIKLLDDIKKNSIDFIRNENRLYRTAKEYVDDVVSFDNLGIGNFNGIFKVCFLFYSLISIVFIIHLINKFILSIIKRSTVFFSKIHQCKK